MRLLYLVSSVTLRMHIIIKCLLGYPSPKYMSLKLLKTYLKQPECYFLSVVSYLTYCQTSPYFENLIVLSNAYIPRGETSQ